MPYEEDGFQRKAPARTSRWGLVLVMLICAIFLGIYGYASFNTESRQKEDPSDMLFTDDDQGTRVSQYLQNLANEKNRQMAQEPHEIEVLEYKISENETELVVAEKPVEKPELPFPQSMERYVSAVESKLKAELPEPEPPLDPAQQAAQAFSQQLQQQRYTGLLVALQAPSAVSDQSTKSKRQLQALAERTNPYNSTSPYGSTSAYPQGAMLTNQMGSRSVGAVGGYGQSSYTPQNGFGAGYAVTPVAYSQPNQGYQGGVATQNYDLNYDATGISSQQTLRAYQGLANPDTTLSTYVEPVLSPFLLRQGVVIPCVLLTGINSDLPGFIQAQVTQDVYDSPLGQYLLIPQGSKIVGQYAASPKLGQNRLMLAFNRIIFPDGKAMSLGAMPGSSLDGYSGFDAEVDTHFWQLMGNAILLGGITAGISISVDEPRDDNGNLTFNGALSQGLGQSIGRVLTQVIERNLVVSPTLKVQPGLEFNVTLIQDIYFNGPYQAYH